MLKFLPPRLRMPVRLLVVGAIAIGIGVAVYGWSTVPVVGPFVLVAAAGYYVVGGRDSDAGALVRGQADERQAYRQLQMQALVGKVMTAAAVIAYFAALVVKATLWPFALAIAVPVLTMLAGRVIYREHGDGQDDMDVKHA